MSVTSQEPRARWRWSRLAAPLALLALTVAGVPPFAQAQTATKTSTPGPTPTATPRLERLAISPITAKRQVGQSQNFTATGFYSDGNQKNLTLKVIYSSSDLNVVFPPNAENNPGRVEAVGAGTAVISATEPTTGVNSNQSNDSATMEVVEAPTPTPTRTGTTPTATRTPTPTPTATPRLMTLVLAPATAKRGAGQIQNFTATGTYSDGSTKNLTQTVNYSSSNTAVAQTPNEDGNKGKVLAVGAGVATISAVDPATGVSTNAAGGGNAEFTVTIPPTTTPTRTGATPTKTLSPTPTVTATPILTSLALSPATAKRKIGETQSFSATGTYSDGSTKNLTQTVIYSSSNLNVVFPPNAQNNRGRVDAVGVGTAIISATDPATGINSNASDGSATMEVVEAPTPTPTRTDTTPTATRTPTPTPTATPRLMTLVLAPATAKRGAGQIQNFTATGTYSDGSTKNLTQTVNYSSSNSAVAQTPNESGNKGKVLAVGAGVATISAVDPASGVSSNAPGGGSAEFTVTIPPTTTPTRTGATPTKTLSPTPTVTATPILTSLALSPVEAKRGVGAFQNFTATGTYSDGSTKNLTQQVNYASSDTNVAVAPNSTTSNKGRVNAVGVGVAIISATDPLTGIKTVDSGGNATFTVVEAATPTPTRTGSTPTPTRTPTPTPTSTPRLLTIALSPLTVKKAAGQFQVFSVNGTYSDGSTKNITQKVDYSSSNPAVASAPNDPTNKSKVLAVAPGVATISATDPATGIKTSTSNGDATFTVTKAPTPTPTRTGPTSTGPTETPTRTPSPSPTATPKITAISLAPKTAQKPVGGTQNFTATATFSDGSQDNVTQRLVYTSSDPTVVQAPNEAGNKGKVIAIKIGTVTISATDPSTGVSSEPDGSATLTIVEGKGTPNPRVTATPILPVQTGDPATTCQRDLRRAGRTFIDKKLKALDRCGAAASRCVQRKPNDPSCLAAVRVRCAAILGKLAGDEAKLIATVVRRCAALSNADVLGQAGLAFGDIGPMCSERFGRTLTDLASVAQCLAAQHSCRAEELFAFERPRAGELLDLVGATPDAGGCREDFGGSGIGLGDPKGRGKTLERCVQAIVRGGAALARTRLASVGRCVDEVFLCVHADAGNGACIARATLRCDREFARIQREIGKVTLATAKRCKDLDFAVLGGASGANLDAVTPLCPDYGIPVVTTVTDYVACLVHQHECQVADLVRFESPRAVEMLVQTGRTLTDGTCPAP